jgi:hypothetical protein
MLITSALFLAARAMRAPIPSTHWYVDARNRARRLWKARRRKPPIDPADIAADVACAADFTFVRAVNVVEDAEIAKGVMLLTAMTPHRLQSALKSPGALVVCSRCEVVVIVLRRGTTYYLLRISRAACTATSGSLAHALSCVLRTMSKQSACALLLH